MFKTLAAVAAFSMLVTPVQAQGYIPVSCGERSATIKHLAEKYSEHPAGLGLTASGGALELHVSDSGSWTILLTTPNGTACIVASGENWQSIAQKYGPKT